jgi:hypothetical protein
VVHARNERDLGAEPMDRLGELDADGTVQTPPITITS